MSPPSHLSPCSLTALLLHLGRFDFLYFTGKAVFEAIQMATDTHFAASDDLTGNVKSGKQDWVMESDGVNVKPLYFVGDTSRFSGNFGLDDFAIVKEDLERMLRDMHMGEERGVATKVIALPLLLR